MDEPEELLDLVDDNDTPIGTIHREDIPKLMDGTKTGMVRAANVFIVNDAGKFWIPKRGPHKKIAPNGLDFSAGEHVMAGESYEQAAVRGMQEELGMRVSRNDLEYIGIVSNKPAGLPYFSALYIYRGNDVPQYNKDDFVSFRWLDPQALLKQLDAGVPAKKDMKLAVALFNNTKGH